MSSIMAAGFGDGGSGSAKLLQRYGPQMQGICREWARFDLNFPAQQSKVWTISAICAFESINTGGGVSGYASPVQDATAPPAVRTGYRRAAPRMLAYKARRRIKRRSDGGGSDDGGPDWGDGRFGGSGGGWNGDNNGGGGDHFYWRGNWNDEGWDWNDAADLAFDLLYHMARWFSLSQCVRYALSRVIHIVDNPSRTVRFARCSSIFDLHEGDQGFCESRTMSAI